MDPFGGACRLLLFSNPAWVALTLVPVLPGAYPPFLSKTFPGKLDAGVMLAEAVTFLDWNFLMGWAVVPLDLLDEPKPGY